MKIMNSFIGLCFFAYGALTIYVSDGQLSFGWWCFVICVIIMGISIIVRGDFVDTIKKYRTDKDSLFIDVLLGLSLLISVGYLIFEAIEK